MDWLEIIKQEKKKSMGSWVVCILLTLITGVIQSFVLVYLLKRIIEIILRRGENQVILLILFLVAVCVNVVLVMLRQKIQFRFFKRIAVAYEDKLIDYVYSNPKNQNCDKVFTLMQSTVSKLVNQYLDTVLGYWNIAITIIVVTVYTFVLSYEAVLICYVVTGLGLLLMRKSNSKIQEVSQESTETFNQVYAEMLEYLRCSEMLPFLEETVYDEFEEKIQRNQKSLIELTKHTNMARICMRFSNVGIVLIAIIYFGMLTIVGKFSIADLSAIIMLLPVLADALFKIPNQMAEYNTVKGMGNSIDEFLKTAETVYNEIVKDTLGRIADIEVKNLSFSYNQETVQCAVKNFHATNGQVIGIFGESGSGKTTFLKLLLKELDGFAGALYINGKPIQDISQRALWNEILYLQQESVLLPLSVRDNITLKESEYAQKEKIQKAIKLADLDNLVESFEDKESHIVSVGNLSSGELQKLCLARCFYTDKSVMILDEATNAMSPNAEQKVLNNLITEVRLTNKILILISHNQDVIAMCDSVLRMKEDE
ncbi:ABC transporter ATP-binding protein [Anaerosporobacter sp.]|uniref:ABC transporter ATP-binding protein n=1 Tax=Anaerosporobacter sp. TaxID=1872529 RepID=UPI00286F31AD|nr:ABC transporter ATP-binding protein [Anaerosporobacter sp.]